MNDLWGQDQVLNRTSLRVKSYSGSTAYATSIPQSLKCGDFLHDIDPRIRIRSMAINSQAANQPINQPTSKSTN
jgi:hypothetical protein